MVNGKGVAHFKKRGTGVAEDTKGADGETYKVDRFKLFLSSDWRGAYFLFFLVELEARLVSKPTASSNTSKREQINAGITCKAIGTLI